MRERNIFTIIVIGLFWFAALVATVFITGQTFGQRCTAAGYQGSEHRQCVQKLSQGGQS